MSSRTSTQAGNWSDSSTWGGLTPPGNGDTAIVAHAVTVDSAVTVGHSPIGAPSSPPVLAKTTGGSLTAATYWIRYSHVDTNGIESDLSPLASIATSATLNFITVTLPALPSGVSNYRVYALISGAVYFFQITAGAGANNLSIFSNTTPFAPLYALRVSNPNGRLTINADLTIKGSLGLDGTTSGLDLIVTQAAGTTVEFDASSALNTSFGYQAVMGNFVAARRSNYWKANGTALSRCVIRSNAGGGNAYFNGITTETGNVELNYTDVTRIGTATADAFTAASTGTNARVVIFGCVFDTCGRFFLGNALTVSGTASVSLSTWKNTLNPNSFYMSGAAASPTGTRLWTGNVSDKAVRFALPGFTIGESTADADTNIFLQMPVSAGAQRTPATIQNSFFRSTSVSSAYRLGDWLECVMVVDGSTYNGAGAYTTKANLVNPHWVTPTTGPSGTYVVRHTIFESFGADDNGDVNYGDNASGFNSTFEYCIGLPEDRDTGHAFACGTLATFNGWSGAAAKYNHNTWYLGGQGAIAVAEGGTGFAGMVDELQSNIFWNQSRTDTSTTFNRISYEPTHINNVAAITANTVNASKTGHNCRFNLYTGTGTDSTLGAYTDGGVLGHSYHHYDNSGATYGASDVTGDPVFNDPSVRFWTWVQSIAGATLPGNASPDRKDYQAYGLYKLSLKNEPNHPDYDAAYTLNAYKAFIRAGFTPHSTALHGTAHDGTDIGAVDWAA